MSRALWRILLSQFVTIRSMILVRSAEMALNEAIRITRAMTRAADIGRVIETSISQHGFKPIQNLSGHSLEQFTIHAGKSIPNIKTIGSSIVLIANHAYAIEPFLTTKDGQGVVYEGKTCNIFSVISRKPRKKKVSMISFKKYGTNTKRSVQRQMVDQ